MVIVNSPLDKRRNAERGRLALGPLASAARDEPPLQPADPGLAPLLRKLLADYAATGRPPAYVPLPSKKETPDE